MSCLQKLTDSSEYVQGELERWNGDPARGLKPWSALFPRKGGREKKKNQKLTLLRFCQFSSENGQEEGGVAAKHQL